MEMHSKRIVKRNDIVNKTKQVRFHAVESFDDLVDDAHAPAVRGAVAHSQYETFVEPNWCSNGDELHGVQMDRNPVKPVGEIGECKNGNP